ncbi:MAG: sugar nucleotide-binding protein [Gammaproteobacteria bacterium]|jgi:dTDP-4-dehydrorhamnose reductase
MRIVVLGSTGMLGNAVGNYFINSFGEDNVCLSYRTEQVAYGVNRFYFDPLISSFDEIPQCDYLINCIGVIKPFVRNNYVNTIKINSIFPRELADYCEAKDIKLIHITTDCVFSGKEGGYTEASVHDCLDEYGKSKSLGESDNCMLIRTSIIGEELHNNASLIAWAKSQKGSKVNGFVNHLWNGITAHQYAIICSQIIRQSLHEYGLFHVFSNCVSKYELLHLINDKFALNLKINAFDAPVKIDRTLATCRSLMSNLEVPDIEKQIIAL